MRAHDVRLLAAFFDLTLAIDSYFVPCVQVLSMLARPADQG
eukprot:SAG31_NODE_2808_length_5065_cov_2.968788_1_plen_41_part_00